MYMVTQEFQNEMSQ